MNQEADRILATDITCTGCGKLMALSNSHNRTGGGYYCPSCYQSWGEGKTVVMRANISEIAKSLFGVEPGRGVCPFCKSSFVRPEDFKDALSRREFRISGLCQGCQDETFGQGDDDC